MLVASYFSSSGSIWNTIRLITSEQQLAAPCKSAALSSPRVSAGLIFSAQRSPISSRVRQNAAALLFDLGTVDIR